MRRLDLSRALWRKSSYSNGTGGSCVETTVLTGYPASDGGAMAVRDSKDPRGPVLAFTEVEWRALTARIKNGQLDLA
jgi:hypothetical protein